MLVVDVDESDPAHPVSVEAHHVGRWHFITLRRQVDNSRDIADLDINLDQLPDKDRTVVKHGLVGTLTVTDRAALDACLRPALPPVRRLCTPGNGTPTSR